MPLSQIKFKSSVTSRIQTRNLEQQLLHALLSDKLNLQRTIGKHRSEFFTTASRLFVYDCIMRIFDERHTTLNREQFEFEINKRFDPVKDKSRIDDYLTEFDLVKKVDMTENVDVIIKNLEEVQLANSTEALLMETFSKLESGDYAEAANILKRKSIDLGTVEKENKIYNLHKDNKDWFEEVKRRKEHPELYSGIPTGFREFDEKTGGLFPAELTVVFGLSGKGKSTLMKAMACNIRKTGRNVLHCGNEENEFQMRSKYMSADSGTLYTPFKRGTYTDEEYISLKKYSDGEQNSKGAIYIYEFPQQTDATWIERAYRQLEMQGIHIDAIVVDYLDLMKPCEKAYSENDEGGKVTSDLKQVAINCNVPVITATQAGIQSEKQEKKERPFLNQSDVFGTKRKVHSANCLIGIVNQTATAQAQDLTPEQRRIHHLVLCVPKNRDGAVFVFRQKMDSWTGKFYEDDGDSQDEKTLQTIASEALKMCDDTLLPGQMVSEISADKLKDAKLEDLRRQVKELEEEQRERKLKEEQEQSSSTSENTVQEANGEDKNDAFISDAPDSSSSESVASETEPEDKNYDDFFNGDTEEQNDKTGNEQSDEPEDKTYDDFFNGDTEKKEEQHEETETEPEPESDIEEQEEVPNVKDEATETEADRTGGDPLTPFDKKGYEEPPKEISHKGTLLELMARDGKIKK